MSNGSVTSKLKRADLETLLKRREQIGKYLDKIIQKITERIHDLKKGNNLEKDQDLSDLMQILCSELDGDTSSENHSNYRLFSSQLRFNSRQTNRQYFEYLNIQGIFDGIEISPENVTDVEKLKVRLDKVLSNVNKVRDDIILEGIMQAENVGKINAFKRYLLLREYYRVMIEAKRQQKIDSARYRSDTTFEKHHKNIIKLEKENARLHDVETRLKIIRYKIKARRKSLKEGKIVEPDDIIGLFNELMKNRTLLDIGNIDFNSIKGNFREAYEKGYISKSIPRISSEESEKVQSELGKLNRQIHNLLQIIQSMIISKETTIKAIQDNTDKLSEMYENEVIEANKQRKQALISFYREPFARIFKFITTKLNFKKQKKSTNIVETQKVEEAPAVTASPVEPAEITPANKPQEQVANHEPKVVPVKATVKPQSVKAITNEKEKAQQPEPLPVFNAEDYTSITVDASGRTGSKEKGRNPVVKVKNREDVQKELLKNREKKAKLQDEIEILLKKQVLTMEDVRVLAEHKRQAGIKKNENNNKAIEG